MVGISFSHCGQKLNYVCFRNIFFKYLHAGMHFYIHIIIQVYQCLCRYPHTHRVMYISAHIDIYRCAWITQILACKQMNIFTHMCSDMDAQAYTDTSIHIDCLNNVELVLKLSLFVFLINPLSEIKEYALCITSKCFCTCRMAAGVVLMRDRCSVRMLWQSLWTIYKPSSQPCVPNKTSCILLMVLRWITFKLSMFSSACGNNNKTSI